MDQHATKKSRRSPTSWSGSEFSPCAIAHSKSENANSRLSRSAFMAIVPVLAFYQTVAPEESIALGKPPWVDGQDTKHSAKLNDARTVVAHVRILHGARRETNRHLSPA